MVIFYRYNYVSAEQQTSSMPPVRTDNCFLAVHRRERERKKEQGRKCRRRLKIELLLMSCFGGYDSKVKWSIETRTPRVRVSNSFVCNCVTTNMNTSLRKMKANISIDRRLNKSNEHGFIQSEIDLRAICHDLQGWSSHFLWYLSSRGDKENTYHDQSS